MASEHTCDLLIIGSGPAGCTAGLYGARAKLRTVISSPTELSGMMARAPMVANFPGQLEPVPGRELLERLHQQALNAGAEHILEAISGVDFRNPEDLIVYGGHQEHHPATVIVATGAMGRAQKAAGEEEFLGRGVCYCAACDGPFFAGEDILVVGDDTQAAEEALTLAKIANSVRFVSSGTKLSLDWDLQQALQECPNLEVQSGLKLDRIVGNGVVTGAAFHEADGSERLLPGAGIFLYLRGNAPATDFLGGALDTEAEGFLVTDELFQTSVPGVFAAGDVRNRNVRQMVVAAGEGASAALAAEKHVHRSARIRSDRGAGR